MSLSVLFTEEDDAPKAQEQNNSPLVQEQERSSFSPAPGVTIYRLTRSNYDQIEFLMNVFEPGANLGNTNYSHSGIECGYILEGELQVTVGKEVYTLKAGDSISFCAESPHLKANRGLSRSVSIWANTPASF